MRALKCCNSAFPALLQQRLIAMMNSSDNERFIQNHSCYERASSV